MYFLENIGNAHVYPSKKDPAGGNTYVFKMRFFFVFPIIAFRSPKPMCGCGCGRIFWHGSGGATSGPPCSRMQKDVTTVCLETQLPTLYKKEA